MRRALAALVLLAAAAGCGPDRASRLQQEIAQLQQDRVPRKAVDDARSEVDAAEAAAHEGDASLGALREERAGLEREQVSARSALAAEEARTEQARREATEIRQRAQAAMAEAEELEKKVQQARLRASAARDQAAAFAREVRPGDETWATERRLRNLSEFLSRLAREYPDDPVLAELARHALHGDDPQAASDLAARARDRMTAVYGLAAPAVAAPPAPEAVDRSPSP